MFYSQTFLARKGPLSTVWIAAHLQSRLRKSHYTSTDIPSTVQHIMDPGVPIALRMSGHLLLGVVRIYSKKVDYLFLDCNDVLKDLNKTFASIQVSLPEDTSKAPFHSITLPETFHLDAVNMDDVIDLIGVGDVHRKNQEDITLTDQLPVVMDHYVAISFDEDIMVDSSHTEVLPDSEARPMEEDISPQSPARNVVGVEDHGPSTPREMSTIQPTSGDTHGLGPGERSPPQETQVESIEIRREPNQDNNLENPPLLLNLEDNDANPNRYLDQTMNESTPRKLPTIQLTSGDTHGLGPSERSPPQETQVESIETCREPNRDHDLENPPIFLNLEDNDAEPNKDLDQTMNENDHDVREMIGDLGPEGMPVPSPQHFQPQTPVTSQGGTLDAQAHVENNTPLVLQESQPRQQPQRRGRRKRQFFDDPITLTNKFMRLALKNPQDILRKRRDVPSSNLDTWKLNNKRRKEHIFDQPLLSGSCKDLLDISQSEYVRSRPPLVNSEGDHMDVRIDNTLSPDNQIPEEPVAATPTVAASNMETEHLRNVVASPTCTIPAHNVAEGDSSSPGRRDDLTIASHPNLGSVSVASLGTNIGDHTDARIDNTLSPAKQFPEEPIAATPIVTASMETEQLRNAVASSTCTIPAYDDTDCNYSISGRDDLTTASPHNLGSVSVASLGTMQTSDSDTCRLRGMDAVEDTDTMQRGYENEEFWFLKVDSFTPASSQGTSGSSNALSERTSHVAQYLKGLSPISPILEETAGDLSLNKILEGQTQKVSARMFFEVLVLKTHALIDVQQEEPYGDVSLKLDPMLSNAQI